MANYSINFNLSKITGAKLVNAPINGVLTECILIPTADMFKNDKGVHLNAIAFSLKEPKFDNTHMIKQSVETEKYKLLSKEEKEALPIIGGMKVFEFQKSEPVKAVETIDISVNNTVTEMVTGDKDGDDLPF